MRTIALAAGALFAALATAASAQYYGYGGRWVQRADGDQECWNPHAGHFERVRPGEVQNDLDFSRCRYIGSRYAEPLQPPPVYANPYERGPRYAPGYGWYAQGEGQPVPPPGYQCWNPHAGHYEEVRPGPPQGDLDFSRCYAPAYR
jgi:hypothetical protein